MDQEQADQQQVDRHERVERLLRDRGDDGGRTVADVTRVRRQVTAMSRRTGGEFERQLKEALKQRRATRPSLARLVDLAPEVAGLGPLTYGGELLVKVAPERRDAVVGLLRGFGGFRTRPVDCPELDERLLCLVRDDADGRALQDAVRLLRQAGYAASANYVTPLGPVAKGMGGPEVAEHGLPARPDTPPADDAVCVAVLDNGITAEVRTDGWLRHVPRGGNLDPLDALPQPDGYLDFAAGHGTFVAGVVQQVAPDCRVVVRNPMNSDGVGSALDVACAMVRAVVDDGALVLNLSLGTETVDDEPPVALEAALEVIRELDPRVLVVAAAGNSGSTRPTYPAALRPVVAVAALTAPGGRAEWSSRGHWVDCSAVGEGVLSTYVEGTESALLDPEPDTFGADAWALASGTSFAAPQVAGVVAQLCQQSGQHDPRRWLVELLATGTDLPDFGRALRILPGT